MQHRRVEKVYVPLIVRLTGCPIKRRITYNHSAYPID
jgi:hypothetical protein